jgi:hypothetical protein
MYLYDHITYAVYIKGLDRRVYLVTNINVVYVINNGKRVRPPRLSGGSPIVIARLTFVRCFGVAVLPLQGRDSGPVAPRLVAKHTRTITNQHRRTTTLHRR